MNSARILPLIEVVKPYDVLIFDIWGVLYDGVNLYPDTLAFLNQVIDEGKKVIFLSNTPRPGSIMANKFIDWGFDMRKATIYTSGDALREQLAYWNDEVFKNLGKKCYHIGADRNQDLLKDIVIDLTENIKEADFILITAYSDENEDLSIYDADLKEAANLKLEAICPNPDLIVQQSNGIRYCAGTFAKKYEALDGLVHYYGKPEIRIFNGLFNKHLKNIEKSKILMIGDTMNTDILGANRAGIDSALVLTGNGEEISAKILNGVDNIFKDYQSEPTWITDGVKLHSSDM